MDSGHFKWSEPRPDKNELNRWCSARFRSSMEDFPEFLRFPSKIRVTAFIPEISFPQDDLAEDGRKKSTQLPPLEKEASFLRAPRKGANQGLFTDDAAETKNLKRVSVEVDRKIVTHLKRHLNKRIQKRFDLSGDQLEYRSDEERDKDTDGRHKASQSGKERQNSIFTNYSETGEKLGYSPRGGGGKKVKKRTSLGQVQTTPRNHQTSPVATNGRSRRSSGSTSSSLGQSNGGDGWLSQSKSATIAEDVSEPVFGKPSPLPDIRRDSDSTSPRRPSLKTVNGEDGVNAVLEALGDLGDTPPQLHNNTIDAPAPEDEEDEDNDLEEEFRNSCVSPVQTPSSSRPQTRENAQLSAVESMTQILNGTVHRKCPRDRTILNLYIAAGYSDTDTERSFMQEHLYPQLQSYCKQRGHELRVFDPHWGFKDAVTDDHRTLDVMKKAIEKSQDRDLGINFVVLLGQKYGSNVLPPEIPREELDAICDVASTYADRQRMLLHMKMADVESQRLEREKGKPQLDDTESIISTTLDTTPESARTNDDLPSTARNEEDREEVEVNDSVNNRRRISMAVKRDQQAIRLLRETEEQLPDVEALQGWYVLDENAVPPMYRLQNISTLYKDILRNDATKRNAAKTSFAVAAKKMMSVLHTFAPDVIKDKQSLRRYFTSVLDMEVETILDHEAGPARTACLVRTIDGLHQNLSDSVAGHYLDMASDKPPTLDTDATSKIRAIRNSMEQGRVPTANVTNFILDWAPGGIRTLSNREHFVYAERVCKTVLDQVTRHLTDSCQAKLGGAQDNELFAEVAEHVRCCHEKAEGFQGRKEILTTIKAYLRSNSRHPLVLHGKIGAGKSAIIGKTAKEIFRWFKGMDYCPRVLVRMIGCTMTSSNVCTMLRDVCLQLCHIYGHSPAEVPTDYKGIFNDLGCRIGHATAEKPLVIMLDGLDRLSEDHEGRKLQWLPPSLPPHVHLIISTTSDDRFDCLPCARKLLNGRDTCFLDIGQLPEADSQTILKHWLDAVHRTITDSQMGLFVDAFQKCPYPLFLKLTFNESVNWASYTKLESIKLGDTVKKVAMFRFGRLERDHGEPLTRRALGYISAARHGLTSNEMEDVLSLDEAVMDDVMATHHPPRRRIPTLLWYRLRVEVQDLLTECRADNMKTMIWAYKPVSEAAEERYLTQRDKAPSYHKALSDYFLGLWAGKPKPYTGNDRGSDRLVSEQELFYDPPIPSANGADRVYNLRKINELPFHLTRSQQTSLLKQNCLCCYEWMLAKLCGTSLRALLDEYQTILIAEPHEPELRMLSDVLHLSGKALRNEPRQLASQLVGRLHRIITADNPRAPGDPRKFPNLHPLLAAAKSSSIPALIPSVECLTEPGGILFDLLSGHSDPITALTLTSDGMRALTTSEDKTMKLWDIRSGKVVKSIDGVGPRVSAVRTAKNNSVAITVEVSIIKIWSLKSGKCVHVVGDYVDPASISVAMEGQILVSVFDGSNMFRSWSMDDFSMLCEADIPDNSIYKDNSIIIADSSYGEHVLHGFRSGNFATVQHAKNGKILKTLQCNEKSSSLVALAISREYFIVCCRQQYMALHEIHILELFDAKRGTYIRSVRGCVHDNIRGIFVNLIGSHAIAVCANERNNTSNIALWNLETEDHKHLATYPCVSTMGACCDFRYCLTGAEGENSLRIWDLSSKVNQPAPKLKKQLGVSDIWPMLDNPRYVVAKSLNNGPISVWNVAKGKCLQSAVRIERGLTEASKDANAPRDSCAPGDQDTEGSDALVMRNTRLVILTDRGFSNVSDDSRPVFQTVLVYDLRLKKYVRRLPGCYIVPAPSHEYVLLDNDSLLGPSDNRSHFIVWNLVSGHAVSRIKTGFKELERKRLEQGLQLVDVPKVKRGTSAMMTPWDRRAESKSARRRREDCETEKEKQRLEELRKEKDNVVEQFLVSGDQKIIVASFYAHHLCVFDIETQTHTQTLQTEYSMMFLHTAALTFDGGHLVHPNYDEDSKISYVTLWDCVTGEVKRRLKKETNVSALALTDDAQRVVIGKAPNELHIWDPMKTNSLKRIRGYDGLQFEMNSKIFIADEGSRAVVFAGDISIWDLEKGTVLAVFSPDTRIMVCNVVLNGQLIVFGLYDKPELVILRLMGDKLVPIDSTDSKELFGETSGDTSEDEEDEEDNEQA